MFRTMTKHILRSAISVAFAAALSAQYVPPGGGGSSANSVLNNQANTYTGGGTQDFGTDPLTTTGAITGGQISAGTGTASSRLVLPELTASGHATSQRIYGADSQATSGCIIWPTGVSPGIAYVAADGGTTATTTDGQTCHVFAWTYANTVTASNITNHAMALTPQFSPSTGQYNIVAGVSTGASLGSGVGSNVLLGNFAGGTANTNQIAIGTNAGASASNAVDGIVAIGRNAGTTGTTGDSGVFIGNHACDTKTAGASLVCIGDGNIATHLPGTQKQINASVIIGPGSTTNANNSGGTALTNIVAINGSAAASNSTVIGNSSTTDLFLFGVPTSGAGSKKVLCIDTATQKIYASTTATDCS